jgi:predicted TIM-barrel fold metal-dependent hydrolase
MSDQPSRRSFLTGAAGFAAGVLGPGLKALSQRAGGGTEPRRIDAHSHFTSPGWFKELEAANLVPAARKGWTPARSIEFMDKAGAETALISTGQAGGAFTSDRLAKRGISAVDAMESVKRLARESNEYGAKMVSDYPNRFGLFASLPMPDVDASMKELEYARDTLKVDGAFLPTSWGNKYIGDKSFEPLLAELNRRKMVVYTHPTDAACCINIIPGLVPNTIEYGTDTTRMIMSLIVSGAALKYPNIQWIFSHAGGSMPFLIERIIGGRGDLAQILARPAEPNSKLAQLRQFHYDTAQSSNPVAMTALKRVVGISQIVFGTDFPYSNMSDHVKGLAECGAFNAQELQMIYRNNVAKMLPKYARS